MYFYHILSVMLSAPYPFFPNKSLSHFHVFKSLCDLLNLIRVAYVSRVWEDYFSKDNLPAPTPLRRVTAPSPGASDSVLPETMLPPVYRKLLIDNFHGNIYEPSQN